jgi:ATP-dependent helicase/nuclease subunit B
MLLATGRRIFGDALSLPGVRAFWWPRFERIAAWFVTAERQHREVSTPLATEVRGELTLRGPAGAFVLRGKADRIDRLEDGRLVLIDYKTGSLPSVKEIGFGYAPQLPLEAAIAAAGGFAEVPAGEAARLEYWRLGGGQPAGKIQAFTEGHSKLPPPAELARQASTGLERLIAVFDDPATPYPARPRPDYVPRVSDYDHMARVKEWSVEEPS